MSLISNRRPFNPRKSGKGRGFRGGPQSGFSLSTWENVSKHSRFVGCLQYILRHPVPLVLLNCVQGFHRTPAVGCALWVLLFLLGCAPVLVVPTASVGAHWTWRQQAKWGLEQVAELACMPGNRRLEQLGRIMEDCKSYFKSFARDLEWLDFAVKIWAMMPRELVEFRPAAPQSLTKLRPKKKARPSAGLRPPGREEPPQVVVEDSPEAEAGPPADASAPGASEADAHGASEADAPSEAYATTPGRSEAHDDADDAGDFVDALCHGETFHPIVQQVLDESNVNNPAVLNLFQQLALASPPRAGRLLLKLLQERSPDWTSRIRDTNRWLLAAINEDLNVLFQEGAA